MRRSILFLIAFAISSASCQLEGIPDCAKTCLILAFEAVGCKIDDVSCQCSSTAAIQANGAGCIIGTCTEAGELQQAISGGVALCNAPATTSVVRTSATTPRSSSVVQATTSPSSTASPLPKTTSTSQSPSTTSSFSSTSSSNSQSTSSTPNTTPLSASSSTTPSGADTTTLPVDRNQSSAPNNTGAIVGGVVGGIALICATILGVVYLRKHRREADPALESGAAENKTSGVQASEVGGNALYEKDGTGKNRETAYEVPG